MKTIVIAASMAMISSLAMAGDPSGVWQSEKDEDGDWIHLAIQPCGETLCGTIDEVHGGNPKVQGMTIIEGMTRVGELSWSEGRILDVDEDTWYDSKMELRSPNQLEIFGCIGFGLLCESMTLSRLE